MNATDKLGPLAEDRSLSEYELDQVSGGSPAIAAAACFLALCAWSGYSWDLPIGASKADAAKALGVEHLL
jgi:hypothetical protein